MEGEKPMKPTQVKLHKHKGTCIAAGNKRIDGACITNLNKRLLNRFVFHIDFSVNPVIEKAIIFLSMKR